MKIIKSLFKARKPNVKFLCAVQGVLEAYPITEARYQKPQWFHQEAMEYAERKKNNDEDFRMYDTNRKTIAKCAGIRDLYNTGWIVRSWQDIHINKIDKHNFTWGTPIDQNSVSDVLGNYVHTHNPESFSKCPHLAEKTPILKIETPWIAVVPKGYNILQLPIAYPDHDMFETATGIFNHGWGMMELNVQLLWTKNGVSVIPAGTPLAHYVLVKDEKPTHELSYITQEEKNYLRGQRNIMSSGVNTNYTKLKQMLKDYQIKRGY